MTASELLTFRRITAFDLPLMEGLSEMFGEAFGDRETYRGAPPAPEYLQKLLGDETFFALVATEGDLVVGGLAAYELRKFEQERSEIYLYDLAVRESHRRRGIATRLIEELRAVAHSRGAYVIFVQADTAEEDLPAILLYSRLGDREEVLHFDIPVDVGQGTRQRSEIPASECGSDPKGRGREGR